MARCSVCGHDFQRPEDLVETTGPDGQPAPVCHTCKARAETGSAPPETPKSDTHSLLHAVSQELSAFEQEKPPAAPPPRSHARKHSRHEAEFRIQYALNRDETPHDAEVIDISQGGLRMFTDIPLKRGLTLRFLPGSLNENFMNALVQTGGEVRRVTPAEDGRYDIGVRFVAYGRANEPNRRQSPRHNIQLTSFYRRDGSCLTCKGQVLDIGRGGVRMVVWDDIERGEELTATLRGHHGPFLKTDMRGNMRVVRARRNEEGRFDLGAAFVKVQMVPRAKPPR